MTLAASPPPPPPVAGGSVDGLGVLLEVAREAAAHHAQAAVLEVGEALQQGLGLGLG